MKTRRERRVLSPVCSPHLPGERFRTGIPETARPPEALGRFAEGDRAFTLALAAR
jgi:hypothetical protein